MGREVLTRSGTLPAPPSPPAALFPARLSPLNPGCSKEVEGNLSL